ncbi:MAG TPA: FKBP-type peptidyl-prolyl cis-trans isomerase [Gemmataceae bacterium]|jgi:FKBP-type peptidyl-prolyl cis-trans isomerase FkpA
MPRALRSLLVFLLVTQGVPVFVRGDSSKETAINDEIVIGLIATRSGLKYQDLKVGNGRIAQRGAVAEVHYTGYFSNGKKFDSSRDRKQPFSFKLGGGMVIKGWDEGVTGMKVGGKRKLIIPPELGYGARGAGGIVPPNTTLIFEVELLNVK